MKELKTLKDLENEFDGVSVLTSKLKAEAVKWIKKFSMKTEEGFEMSNVSRAFKKFFNLIEEDLKEGVGE